MNWVWVTFWMCPGTFSGLGEGRAVGIWAERAEFGLSGESSLAKVLWNAPTLGSRRSWGHSLALPLPRAQLPALSWL